MMKTSPELSYTLMLKVDRTLRPPFPYTGYLPLRERGV